VSRVNPENYWEDGNEWGVEELSDVEERWAAAAEAFNEDQNASYSTAAFRRRMEPLLIQAHGALEAAAESDDQARNPPSLATLEKGSHDSPKRDLPPALRTLADDMERGAQRASRKLELFDHPATASLVGEGGDEHERLEKSRDFHDEAHALINAGRVGEAGSAAIQAAMDRDHYRRRAVLELIRQGEDQHARRLATCGRQSVQLECPTFYGGCGHDENYVPVSCKSPLCQDCYKRRMGKEIGRYKSVVEEWSNPAMLRIGLDGRRDDPDAARQELLEILKKFNRRKVPPSGEHQGVRWVWKSDGGEPAKHHWKASLTGNGFYSTAAEWEREYVQEGKWIPVQEIMPARVRGIDQKQGEDGSWNVHAHILADMTYFPQAALASIVEDCGGGPNVDVRHISEKNDLGPTSAVMECIAYAMKPPEAENLEDQVEMVIAQKGAKLVQPGGRIHGQYEGDDAQHVPDPGAGLKCEKCEMQPNRWEYLGLVDEVINNMGVVGGSDSEGPPEPA